MNNFHLIGHFKLAHEKKNKVVLRWKKCVICHEGFPEDGDLIKHFALIHQKKLSNWDKKTGKLLKKLKLSLKTEELKRPGMKGFVCSICNYKVTKSDDLKRHIATIHEKKMQPCSICGTKFALNHELEMVQTFLSIRNVTPKTL